MVCDRVCADPAKLAAIVSTVKERLGMELLGIDVVVERNTGRHAIIDINAYPSWYFDHIYSYTFRVEPLQAECNLCP